MARFFLFAVIAGVTCAATLPAHAESRALGYEDDLYQAYKRSKNQPEKRYLIAQSDEDDSFDPFADYSEFDDASDEEADINFFRHGRFLTLGFTMGMRGFTEGLSSAYSSAPTFGLFLSFFFDMRMALQFGFLTGDHAFSISQSSSGRTLSGNVSTTWINVDLKYYFNTQNVTRGLADLNPYIIGGFGKVDRTVSLSGSGESPGADSTTGLNIGAGLEVPIMRKKGYFGIQAAYRYITFPDENGPFIMSSAANDFADQGANGDSMDFLAILGLNY